MKTLPTWLHRFHFPQKKAKRLVQLRRPHVRPSIEILEDRSLLSTIYTVTSLLDTNTGSGDSGTLRYVLNQVNANHTGTAASPDSIQFAVSGTISVDAANGGALPGLASDEVADIDGMSAPGFNGTPLVTLDGTNAGADANGLTISGGSSIVAGLAIVNFSGNGIQLDTNGKDTVKSCYIGITTAGEAASNGANGIFIDGTPSNTIGGEQILAGNVISGNGGDGILIEGTTASNNTVLGNFIGTDPTGSVAIGNGGNGIQLKNAPNNQIGPSNPVTPVTYSNTDNFPSNLPVSGWQGIRGGDGSGQYLITGTSVTNGVESGLLYEGTIDGSGVSYAVNYPGSTASSVYGPNNLGGGEIQLVGTYQNPSGSATVNGFIFQGTTSDLNNPSNYVTIDMPGADFNYVHSAAGGLAVGNYDSLTGGLLGPGKAFLYDVSDPANPTYITDIVFPGSVSNTAYGIWYNGGTSYTICGGYADDPASNMQDQNQPIGQAYLVDYDSSTGTFSHWTSFSYPYGVGYLTHFEGISSTSPGVYTLNADAVGGDPSQPSQGALVTVTRKPDGSFGAAQWTPLNYPGLDPTTTITSSNSVYGNQVVGIAIGSNGVSYQATVNSIAQLSNVISGNGGNGILIEGAAATGNAVVDNNIGTNVPGTAALGNDGNGIEITNGAQQNTIGGNAPTALTFTGTQTQSPGKPADGNVISANGGAGVLITGGAEFNTLSGNFIGTDVTGMHAFGNSGNGVGIINADNNSLIGTTVAQDPFVYLNLICANGGNGLVIDDSNNTTVQANDFGLADDNATALGNRLDGVLIEGTSQNTQFGGVIPLGNIVAGNGRNGVEIADTASGTVAFNTFCGLPAFVDSAVGNKLDGMLITSTGGNNVLRTNVIAGNELNGIHISGDASGVQVTEDIIGMDTNGMSPLPNGSNGILIDGTAHDNLLGGDQVSVIPQNTISGNDGNGIAIEGNAHGNQIVHSFIGTNSTGTAAYGNKGAGIFITNNANNTTIGGTTAFEQNVISGNQDGIFLFGGGAFGTQIVGNLIGTDKTGQNALPNNGPGVLILSSSNNQIGGTGAGMGNVIAFNTAGVVVVSGVHNAILGNSISSNVSAGIVLAPGTNANNDQPAPVLSAAVELSSSVVQITGTLTAAANTTYSIEFFATPSGTPAGQGQNYLGSITATTNAQGIASIGFTSTLPSVSGTSFTTTATDPVNNSSPFSSAMFASPPAPPSPPSPPPSPSTPTPVGTLTPFGIGLVPGFHLAIFDVDSIGQVFTQPFGTFLSGSSLTFVASELIFTATALQNTNGSLLALLQEQSSPLDLMQVLNLVNPFVFNALLTALMKPV
jgi:hypothetical protein